VAQWHGNGGSAGRQVHDCHVNKREWVVSTPSASHLLTLGYALPMYVALGSADVVKPNYYSMPEQQRSCSSVCPSETANSSACYIPSHQKSVDASSRKAILELQEDYWESKSVRPNGSYCMSCWGHSHFSSGGICIAVKRCESITAPMEGYNKTWGRTIKRWKFRLLTRNTFPSNGNND
jgi:hypothetical protein